MRPKAASHQRLDHAEVVHTEGGPAGEVQSRSPKRVPRLVHEREHVRSGQRRATDAFRRDRRLAANLLNVVERRHHLVQVGLEDALRATRGAGVQLSAPNVPLGPVQAAPQKIHELVHVVVFDALADALDALAHAEVGVIGATLLGLPGHDLWGRFVHPPRRLLPLGVGCGGIQSPQVVLRASAAPRA